MIVEVIKYMPEKNKLKNALKNEGFSALAAIRAKCYDCTCGQTKEIKLCKCTNCPL
jgi:hypothetical protein